MTVEGKQYPSVTVEIEADNVAEFAWSIGADPNDGVPPTYAAVYCLGATASQLFGDEEAAVDFTRLLHAEQEFDWTTHPHLGDKPHSQARVTSHINCRGMRCVALDPDTTSRMPQ